MAQYSEKNYLGRTPSWASFANKDAIMDTTMLSERWHLTVKSDILHRNANSRLDSLVDLLIKAVEDKSESKKIMDRRRLVKSAYRAKETNKCHRKAVAYYAERQENIRSEGERRWSVESMTQGKFFTVEYKGACSCKFMANVHCHLCDVCPYSWTCTCLDNRTGISCVHRHAVKTYRNHLIQPVQEQSPTEIVEEAPEVAIESQQVEAQHRRQDRYERSTQ